MKNVVKLVMLFGTIVSLVGCKTNGSSNNQVSSNTDSFIVSENSQEISNEESTFVSEEIISEDPNIVTLNVLSMNDVHGALIETHASAGLIKGASYIEKVRSDNQEGTILLSAGDMYQGTAVSNLEYGNTMIKCMNELQFDAMAIGNHEFDWGEDIIKNHHDGNLENGEAEYPYVACNIYYSNGTSDETDDTKVPWTQDYIVIERKNVKIGIVGWISYSCKDDIAEPIMKDFSFHKPILEVKEAARKARQEDNCDIVIALGHEGNDLNTALTKLDGDSKIDFIINGHSHSYYTNKEGIPSVQSGSSLQYIANTTIKFDIQEQKVVEVSPYQEKITSEMEENSTIKEILDIELKDYQYLFEPITTAKKDLSKTKVGQWIADCVRKSTGSDVGIVNSGGVRDAAFPIEEGNEINEERMWMLMPFDNEINTCYLYGVQVESLSSNRDGFIFDFDYRNTVFEAEKLYKVAACDYVFNKTIYPFLQGQEVTETKLLVRDMLIKDLKEWGKAAVEWDASTSLLTSQI